MQITIYTIKDCPFCKAEKDFLTSHNLPFTEKNVEENREYLSEMLEASDKFAGVPFTLIVKDDGTKVPLKGFTESEFLQALGMQPMSSTDIPITATTPAQASEPVAEPIINTPPMPSIPVVEEPGVQEAQAGIQLPSMPEDKPVEPPVVPTPPIPEPIEPTMPAPTNASSDDLQGVLNNLSAMAGVNPTPAPPSEPNPEPPIPEPTTPTEEPSPTIDHTNDMNNPSTPSQPTVPNVPDLPQG